MKKKLNSLIFCFLIVFSAIGFSACNETVIEHNILATSSNSQKGTVSGSGFYKTNYTVAISATPKTSQTFICWVKDDVVVSYEQNYNFIASTATAGKYTALFSTTNLEYFMVSGMSYNISGLELTDPSLYLSKIIDFKVKMSEAPSLYTDLGTISNEAVGNTGNFSSNNFAFTEKILYLSKIYYFSISLKVEYTNITTSITTTAETSTLFSINFANLLSGTVSENTTTVENENYTLTQTFDDGAYSINVDYVGLSTFANWNEDVAQNLVINFSYPFVE